MADNAHGQVKRFAGEGDEPQEYKQWKKWALSHMATKPGLTPEGRGPFLYTLLDGTALDTIDHVEFSEYSVSGGDDILWALLDDQYPETEEQDEVGGYSGHYL